MSTAVTAQQICEHIQDLPEESLGELAKYIEFLRFKARMGKWEQLSEEEIPFRVVAKLEGLLADYPITDEEIAAARREMWGKFGEREP